MLYQNGHKFLSQPPTTMKFNEILEDNNIQIACIIETWFDAEKGTFTSTIKDEGYKILHSPRTDKRGGGTAIIYKENLKVKEGAASSSKYQSLNLAISTLKIKGQESCYYASTEDRK